MQNKTMFFKRVVITALWLLFYLMLSSIPLWISEGGGEINFLTQIAIINGGSGEGVRFFSLGLMPFFMSSLVVKMLTQGLSPTLAEKSRGTQAQRKSFEKIKTRIFYSIAIMQSFSFLIMSSGGDLRWIDIAQRDVLLSALGLFVGTLVAKEIAEQITRRGIGNGFVLIISLMLIRSLVANALNVSFDENTVVNVVVLMTLFALGVFFQSKTIGFPVVVDTLFLDERNPSATVVREDRFRVNLLCVGITPIVYLTFILPIFEAIGIKHDLVVVLVSIVLISVFVSISVKSDFNAERISSTLLHRRIMPKLNAPSVANSKTAIERLFQQVVFINTLVLSGFHILGLLVARFDFFSTIQQAGISGVQILLLSYAVVDIFYSVNAYFVKTPAEIIY